jgi:hypothetical protein
MAKGSKNQQEPFSARFLNDFVEFTAGDIQKTRKTAMLFTLQATPGVNEIPSFLSQNTVLTPLCCSAAKKKPV